LSRWERSGIATALGPDAVAPHAQGGLLGHDPAREERRGGLAEQLRHLGLDLGDQASFGVHVPLRDVHGLGVVGERAQHLDRGVWCVPEHRALAGLGGRAETLHQLVVHRTSQPARVTARQQGFR